jgi:hypothetical protein
MPTQVLQPPENKRSTIAKTGFESRRQQAIRLTSDACHKWFNFDGEWIHPVGLQKDGRWTNPPQPLPKTYNRLIFWLCMGLLDGSEEDVRLGNAILERTPLYLKAPDSEGDTPAFDIFVSNHAMQMLILHGDKLSASIRLKLESWARVGLRDYRGNRQSDLQFHGFNDNMPAKATLGLILGGEYFGDTDAVEHGLWNLRQLRDLLTRRGLISEYNSPTYTPFTLVNLTEVAHHARHPEAREIAGQCVERLWADVFSHYHAPTGMAGGPYSRAYHFDSVGHLSTLSFLLWLILGDEVRPNPAEEFGRESIRLLHAHGFCPESLGRLSWVASCHLNPPPDLVLWQQNRKYPFEVRATSERGGGEHSIYPSEVVTAQRQEKDFSLGTALGEAWSVHQSEPFYLTWRRRQPACSVEDVRVGYLKYLIDEEAPRDPEQSIPTHGDVVAIQGGRSALVLARPALNLAGKPVERLKLSVLFPCHFGKHDHVVVRNNHLFLEDGPVRIALRPLNATNWGGNAELRLETAPNYLLASFYNYEGEPRAFTREELGRTLNGFACIIGLRDECSREEFQASVLACDCVDTWAFGMRTVRFQSPDNLLEIAYAPATDHIRYTALNGRLYPRPTWQADGLPESKLPFLGEDASSPNPSRIPYHHLRASWAPDAPWCIAANGPMGERTAKSPNWTQVV